MPRRPIAFALLLLPALVTVTTALLPGTAFGHPLAPALLELDEREPGRFELRWKRSRFVAPGSEPRPILPEHCRPLGETRAEPGASSVSERWSLDCGVRGLVGEELGVAGLGRAQIDVLLRVALRDGRRYQAVLRPGAASWRVPERPRVAAVAVGYGRLGAWHILTGPDHVLFLLGLLLLVGATRRLVSTVTAFTLGHSLTLALAALGVVRLATAPIEFLIAASVLWLAVELAHDRESGRRSGRRPFVLAAGFGLLHGLGFAGALAEVGLPQGEVPLALLSFNLGIELGQLAFLAVLLAGLALWRWLAPPHPARAAAIGRWPAYLLGTLASYWCFERAVLWLL